jgi:hypothetical protein
VCEALYSASLGGQVDNTGPVAGGCGASVSFASVATANAQAIAAPGLLRAYATSSTEPAAGQAAFLSAGATARFTDQFMVGSLSPGTAVELTFQVRVTGHLGSSTTLAPQLFFGDAQNTTGSADFDFHASLGSSRDAASVALDDCVHGELRPGISVCNNAAPPRPAVLSVDETMAMSIIVENGDLVTLDMTLRAGAFAVATRDGSAAAGEANMFDTVQWLGLSSAMLNGQPYGGPLILTSDSGYNYLEGPPSEAIAEPTSLALALGAFAALGLARSRRLGQA